MRKRSLETRSNDRFSWKQVDSKPRRYGLLLTVENEDCLQAMVENID